MATNSECLEQIKVFDWINLHSFLKKCSFHIPNEGKRSLVMGRLLKSMGMRSGVSDIFIAYPIKDKAGLWIELKAKDKKGKYRKPTVNQLQFIDDMIEMGYVAKVCNGADEAIACIVSYMKS
jgi:hypothetical protein